MKIKNRCLRLFYRIKSIITRVPVVGTGYKISGNIKVGKL